MDSENALLSGQQARIATPAKKPSLQNLGANFGDFGAHVDAMWGHFGQCRLCIVKKQPKYTPPKHSPRWPWRRDGIKSKNTPKHNHSTKTLSSMAGKAKRNEKSPRRPCTHKVLRASQSKGVAPLAELYEMMMFLRKLPTRRQERH